MRTEDRAKRHWDCFCRRGEEVIMLVRTETANNEEGLVRRKDAKQRLLVRPTPFVVLAERQRRERPLVFSHLRTNQPKSRNRALTHRRPLVGTSGEKSLCLSHINPTRRNSGNWKRRLSGAKGSGWQIGTSAQSCTKSITRLRPLQTWSISPKTQKDNSALVAENMETIEQQLALLSRVTSQALAFHRRG
jgi:hypothetical protein